MTFKPALIVIDLQEDFLPSDGSLAVAEGRSIIPKVNQLLNLTKYDWATVIATQDWHPQDHCSFASNHQVPPFTELEFKHPLGETAPNTNKVITMKQIVWPDHCVQHSFGAEISEDFLHNFNSITTIPTSIVKKGYLSDREYYSCFQDCWKLHHTEIEATLVKLGVTDVFFVGLAYDFCVMNSAVDCSNSEVGFKTYVLRDCCKSVYPENDNETDNVYWKNGVKIIDFASGYLKQVERAV